jgi:glutamine amidotransferase-like uncharacterized protein
LVQAIAQLRQLAGGSDIAMVRIVLGFGVVEKANLVEEGVAFLGFLSAPQGNLAP